MIYPGELERARRWKDLATSIGIPIEEDEQLAIGRRNRAVKAVEAEFMGEID